MNLIAIAFSTFLGAAVALAAERLTRLYDAKLTEEAALNSLILDLASSVPFSLLMTGFGRTARWSAWSTPFVMRDR